MERNGHRPAGGRKVSDERMAHIRRSARGNDLDWPFLVLTAAVCSFLVVTLLSVV